MADRDLAVKTLTTGIKLGILGGGQLGRMSAMAAARLGIDVIIYCPEADSPASAVSKHTICAGYDDKQALKSFADQVDFISYEFENIPVETVSYLNSLKPNIVQPSQSLLDVSQNRIKEKTFLNAQEIKTARWAEIKTAGDIKAVLGQWNASEAILKTARFGYDGKGQIRVKPDNAAQVAEFLNVNSSNQFILEELVAFTHEMSIIIARDINGNTVTYDPMLNDHKNHILHTTTVNAAVSKMADVKAQEIAIKVANAVNLIGILTVELFHTQNGDILANEIAPRTHNSGHWTIDACAVSQFENHVRCVCGLSAGSTQRHSDAIMLNLIGDDVLDIDRYMNQSDTYLHLYGKREIVTGRKMGHVTFLKPKT